jgi:c-di-GMP-binding flagellar brake protein YcgR
MAARERRRYARFGVDAAVSLFEDQRELLSGRSLNISDGGALLAAPARPAPRVGQTVQVSLRLPRSTPNSFLLEDVACPAKIVRQQRYGSNGQTALALQFDQPLDLGLDL